MMSFFKNLNLVSKKINRVTISLFSIFLSVLVVWLILKVSTRYEANALLRTFFYEPFLDIQQIKEILLIFAPFLVGSLAVLICYKAGFINLNVSGQMALTGLTVYIAGFYLKKTDPTVNWFIVLILIGITASILLSLLIAFFRIYFQINEVLSGIFFNYIVYYVFRSLVKLPTFVDNISQVETQEGIGMSIAFNNVFGQVLSISLVLALIIFVFISYIMLRSRFGFQLKIMSNHFSATRYAGINTSRQILKTFLLAGILSGIAGLFYYFRHVETSKLFLEDALPSNGFDTLAIVWLAQSSFVGLPFMALFISVLRIQQNVILITEIDAEITEILIGLLILSIAFGNQLYSDAVLRRKILNFLAPIKMRFLSSKSPPTSRVSERKISPIAKKTSSLPTVKKRKREKA